MFLRFIRILHLFIKYYFHLTLQARSDVLNQLLEERRSKLEELKSKYEKIIFSVNV